MTQVDETAAETPLKHSGDDLPLPHRIGHYTLTRRLGRGGMGVVYAARDERLGREVAIKMIAGLSDDSAVKRFWREARTAASVSHPNVCQIYEVKEGPEGIAPVAAPETFPVLAPVRAHPVFGTALEEARRRRRIALAIFERGDGPLLLGIPADRA